MASPLLFIDTNIWLDFYRFQNDAAAKLLARIDGLKPHLILTFQVEMEFKKNRQAVIKKSLSELKSASAPTVPGFLRDSKATKMIDGHVNEINKRFDKLKTRMTRAFKSPTIHDPVFKVAQRAFSTQSDTNLVFLHDSKNDIVERARRRSELGFPPRKSDNITLGDSVNWEWILECARIHRGVPILLVSRDSDYGSAIDKHPKLNDFLTLEFQEVAGRNRRIALFDRLSLALKEYDIKPTQAEVAAEEGVIASNQPPFIGKESFLLNLIRFYEQTKTDSPLAEQWLNLLRHSKPVENAERNPIGPPPSLGVITPIDPPESLPDTGDEQASDR